MQKPQSTDQIRAVEARNTVQVTLPDGKVLEGPVGTKVESFLQANEGITNQAYPAPMMGAVVDGKLRELSYPIPRDAKLSPVLLSSSDGGRIYRRSLIMLLTVAVAELWPGAAVNVNYAVPDGGFYCQITNRPVLAPDELRQLETYMHQIVQEDSPITKRMVPLEEAVQLFTERNEQSKLRLLEQRSRDELTLYTLRNHDDYYYGYMVPSTGYLRYFRIIAAEDGFILQYPRKENPTELGKIHPSHKLTSVFKQSDDWLSRLGVEDIGQLNRIVRNNKVGELILVAEALHEQRIAYIARQIAISHQEKGTRIVLIAGPSSSGKTTFSKRLAIQLLAHGLRPFTLEMDNYFVDRDLTPKDETGEYDFEALHAVNLELFNSQLLSMIKGEEVQLPRFDFILGKSLPDKLARLTKNQLIIIEGIHGLNPELVPNIPADAVFRVYVSALTQLNIDSHNRVPTTDVRLLRRIVRDARHRGNDAAATLSRWQSVRRGEKRNIFPHQENADIMFNSALTYELAVLRPLAEPLLLQVKQGTPAHIEANRLLSFLGWVHPLSPEQAALIPDTSLLREFVGGSILHDYHPVHAGENEDNHTE